MDSGNAQKEDLERREKVNVSEIMTPEPEYLSTNASLRDAALLMKARDVGSVPLVEDGRVAGIVTDRDLVVKGLGANMDPAARVLAVMNGNVLSIAPDEDVDEAFRMMEENRIRRLPVVDGSGALVGMVSLGDLATRTQQREKSAEALEVICEPS